MQVTVPFCGPPRARAFRILLHEISVRLWLMAISAGRSQSRGVAGTHGSRLCGREHARRAAPTAATHRSAKTGRPPVGSTLETLDGGAAGSGGRPPPQRAAGRIRRAYTVSLKPRPVVRTTGASTAEAEDTSSMTPGSLPSGRSWGMNTTTGFENNTAMQVHQASTVEQ